MNKLTTIALMLLMLTASTPIFTSCSDDPTEDIEEEKDESTEGGLIDIPKDIVEKIEKIYSNASIDPQEVTTVNQLAILTSLCASRDGDGPISVTKALLNEKPITLVTLGGTEEVQGQATTMKESQLASFGKPNDYLTAVCKLFEDGTIPPEKPVIITGISLGGMIAQQVLGQQKILDQFDIRAIITFGSPFTLPLNRKGIKVVRFADTNDKVPELGEMIVRSGMIKIDNMNKNALNQKLDELDKSEKISRTSKYTGMIETHALSYIEDSCWDSIDFLGDSAKTNILKLTESMRFYPAPQLKNK